MVTNNSTNEPTAAIGTVLQGQGVGTASNFSTATYPSTTIVSQILYSSASNTVTGLATANRAVLTTGATGVPALTALSTDGQVIIGSTAGAPAAATLTAGTGVSITNASNSITIGLTGGGIAFDSIVPNSGTNPVVPDANGQVTIQGTGSVTTVGGTNSLTPQLTGLTNHSVLVGAGTATITNVAPSATSGVPFISQGASSDPVFGTAVVAGGGTGQVTLTNHGVLVGAGTTAITQLAAGTAGQVLQSGGASADPAYSTATYPSTATGTGTILRADGTNWVATTATYPDTAGTSGNVLTSNGTNWVSSSPTNGWVFLSSQTATASSALTFTSGITATYNNYVLVCSNISVGGALNLTIQISTNGGSSYINTNYLSGISATSYNSNTVTNNNVATGFLIDNFGATTIFGENIIYLRNFTSGSNYVATHNTGTKYNTAISPSMSFGGGAYTTISTTVNAFQVVPTASTFSGVFTLYGIKES